VEAKNMNDYIDIGIFAANSTTKDGRSVVNPLFFKKYKLSAGVHSFTVLVKGKPVSAGIDPDAKLVDRQPNDNMKGL
jgi:ABC-2 type transport system permease protein